MNADLLDRLLAAACEYIVAEKGDPTHTYFHAQLELAEDILDEAVKEYYWNVLRPEEANDL